MKRVLLLGLATLVSSFFAAAQEKPALPSANSEVVKQLKKMEEDRNQAVLRGDAAALDRMTSDDYTFITLRGELRIKSEILKGFKSGSFKYESRDLSDLNVRVYGNTAVVTGRATQKGVEDGKDYSGDYRFTRVYIRQRDHWVTVAFAGHTRRSTIEKITRRWGLVRWARADCIIAGAKLGSYLTFNISSP